MQELEKASLPDENIMLGPLKTHSPSPINMDSIGYFYTKKKKYNT